MAVGRLLTHVRFDGSRSTGLRALLSMPPANRPALGKGPTGKDKPSGRPGGDDPASVPPTPGAELPPPIPGPAFAHRGSSSPSSASSQSPASGVHLQLSPQTPLHTPLDPGDSVHGAVWDEAPAEETEIKPPPTPFSAVGAYVPIPSPVTSYGGPSPVSATYGESARGAYGHSPPRFFGGGHVASAQHTFTYAPAPSAQRHSLPNSLYGAVSPYAAEPQQHAPVQGYTATGYIDASHGYALTSPGSAQEPVHHEQRGVPAISHLGGGVGMGAPGLHLPYPHRRSYTEPYVHVHSLRGDSGSGTPLDTPHAYMQTPQVPPMSAPAGELDYFRPPASGHSGRLHPIH
jgi:hypothetical protein